MVAKVLATLIMSERKDDNAFNLTDGHAHVVDRIVHVHRDNVVSIPNTRNEDEHEQRDNADGNSDVL